MPKCQGVLFFNDRKKSENEPNLKGNIEITREMVAYLSRRFTEMSEDVLKMDLGAWENKSKAGNKYIKVNMSEIPENATKRFTQGLDIEKELG